MCYLPTLYHLDASFYLPDGLLLADGGTVDEIEDLNEEQINAVITFRDEYNEYSVMQIGFSNLINDWYDIQLEKEND